MNATFLMSFGHHKIGWKSIQSGVTIEGVFTSCVLTVVIGGCIVVALVVIATVAAVVATLPAYEKNLR